MPAPARDSLIRDTAGAGNDEEYETFLRLCPAYEQVLVDDGIILTRARWVEYSRARDVIFEHTNTDCAPWVIADLNNKRMGRLNVIRHLLNQISYEDLTPPPLELPERQPTGDYQDPDWGSLFIPEVYSGGDARSDDGWWRAASGDTEAPPELRIK